MKTKFSSFLILLLAAAGLVAWAQEPAPAPAAPVPTSSGMGVAPSTNAPAAPAEAAPPPSMGQEPPPGNSESITNSTNAEVIDITMDDIPLPTAVRQLAIQAGLNIEFDPKLLALGTTADGKPIQPPTVQEKWKGVTAMQALTALLNNYDWQLSHEPGNPIARVTAKDPKALDPLVTTVIPLSYGDSLDVMYQVKAVLTPRDWVTNDVRTHQLVLLCTAKQLPAITNLIAQLDTATRQILIEARIVETTKDISTAKGVNWTGTTSAQHVSFGNGITSGTVNSGSTTAPGATTTAPGGRALGGGVGTVVSNASSFVTTLTGSTLAGGGISANTASGFSPATAFLNADGVSAVMSFLNTDADTKSIALPRTVSLDGVSNRISVVQNFPIFEETQSAPAAGASVGLQTAQPVYDKVVDNNYLSQVGIALSVIPHIAGQSNVIISIKPEISAVDAQTASATINGQVSTAGIYDRSTIETKASVPSGMTLVIGGLDKDVINKTYTKVPILGDIPGMQYIFGSRSKDHQRETILIFITPTIISDADYQPAPSDFEQTRPPGIDNGVDSPWDSAKPYDWTKPSVYNPPAYNQ